MSDATDELPPLGDAELQAIYEDVLFAGAEDLTPALRALRGIYYVDGMSAEEAGSLCSKASRKWRDRSS